MSQPVSRKDYVLSDELYARAVLHLQADWGDYVDALQSLHDEVTLAALVPALAARAQGITDYTYESVDQFQSLVLDGLASRPSRRKVVDALRAMDSLIESLPRLAAELRYARGATKGSA